MKIKTTTISLTNQCNFNCIHCSVNAGEKIKKELNFSEVKNILNQLKKLKVKEIELTGGEPLLRKDLLLIIKYSKKLEFKVKILTNGSLLSKDKINQFRKIGLDKIAISLDGYDYQTYKKIRPVTRTIFLKVLKNIKLVANSGIFIKINTVVMKGNINNLQKIVYFCEKYKIKELRICYFSKVGRGEDLNETIDPKEWVDFIKKLKNKDIKIYLGFSHANFKSSCMLLKEIPLYISSNGNIHLCPRLKSIGNIRRFQLKDVLKNISNKEEFCFSKNNPILENFYPVCPLRKFKFEDIK
ncbi:radical SAM protein [Candidatus Pacearchaeota archaeon]|nr:radical SAM protein [Candidatus Pacearchaeota archaeon]